MMSYPPRGPLLKPGDPPPGKWGDSSGVIRPWVGEHDWRTSHGKAVAQWVTGKIIYVHDALMADGSRQGVQLCSDTVQGAVMPGGILETYRISKEGGFIHGKIDVTAGEVEFAITEQHTLTVEPNDQPLFDAMRGDAALMQDLQCKGMAFALHDVIMRSNWALAYDGVETGFVPRYAGHFVAALRANGEYYLDYYGRLPEGMTDDHVSKMRAHLDRLGINDAGASE